jgi:hypothetical protein
MVPDPVKAAARALRKAERAMGIKLPKTMHCSFCGKSQHQVQKLIAGPGVFICDECVGLCRNIIDGGPPPDPKTFNPLLQRATEDLIELLPSMNFAADASRNFLQGLVDELRKREVSWAVIGEKLGVSRQAAWERFS